MLNIVSPHNGLISPTTGLVKPGLKRHYAEEYFKHETLIQETTVKIQPAVRFDRIVYLLGLICVTIIDQILEGSSNFESILGIVK